MTCCTPVSYTHLVPGTLTLCHCITGRIGWQLSEGQHVYLGPGDFAVYTANAACQALPPQPDDIPQGMILRLDPAQFDAAPPPLLAGTGITGAGLTAKFGAGEAFLPLPGGSETAALFVGLAAGPGPLQAARQKDVYKRQTVTTMARVIGSAGPKLVSETPAMTPAWQMEVT